jgi:hypothetical protein
MVDTRTDVAWDVVRTVAHDHIFRSVPAHGTVVHRRSERVCRKSQSYSRFANRF